MSQYGTRVGSELCSQSVVPGRCGLPPGGRGWSRGLCALPAGARKGRGWCPPAAGRAGPGLRPRGVCGGGPGLQFSWLVSSWVGLGARPVGGLA